MFKILFLLITFNLLAIENENQKKFTSIDSTKLPDPFMPTSKFSDEDIAMVKGIVERPVMPPLFEAHRLLLEANDACWTIVEIDEVLELAGRCRQLRHNSDEAYYKMRRRLAELQKNLDRTSCKEKLKSLIEKVQNLSVKDKKILSENEAFYSADPYKYDTLKQLFYHKYTISKEEPNLVERAINAFADEQTLQENSAESF